MEEFTEQLSSHLAGAVEETVLQALQDGDELAVCADDFDFHNGIMPMPALGRNTDICSTEPGAFSVRNMQAQRLDMGQVTLTEQPNTALRLSSLGNRHDNGYHDTATNEVLPEAMQVSETGAAAIMGTAQQISPMQLESISEAGKLERRKRKCLVSVMATSLVAFAVVMGLIIGLDNGKQSQSSQKYTTPQTQSPTAAPTILANTWDELPDVTITALKDPSSPQAMAYDWVLNDPNRTFYPHWKMLQRFALAVFYFSTGGDNWNLQEHWLSYDLDECSWYFKNLVGGEQDSFLHEGSIETSSELQFLDSACNAEGQYTYFVFTENNLEGTLPPELSLLSNSLKYLEVGSNENLYGVVPSEIALLTNLEKFYVNRNSHSGQIPTELGQLSNLFELELGNNPYTGSLPSELGNLHALSLLGVGACRKLSGTLPTELYRLTNMVKFYLQGLEGLASGSLLPEIGQMTKLERFFVHEISFNSSIPTEIGLLSHLSKLNLWKCHITGSLPSELFLLTNMWRIDIDENEITGTIPTEFGLFPNLTMAWMNGNSFTGTLPGSILESWGQLNYFKINNNNLEGPLPSQLGLLTSLDLLWVSHNEFSGSIPSEIGLLNNVTELFLHDTNLAGSIPETLLDMDGLEMLTISNTSLTGSIPHDLCGSIWDMSYTCNVYFGLFTVCYDVEKVNFTCSSNDLCGCDACGECNSTGS
ncbi:LRR receptor-like serine threonine-protein kinase [Seminavis robusta]|uniref:LRR receptor-like serine threonine-protein kinase n=1 Tax=Seminavis robusta TaxID=568900 RepID=A0A9N8HKJ2_9STRA|nr:LRR receptor-like serine threonine-protein kinase [Seminavis robusta]|eukprot:Sro736_g194990.1 LRR receptor-like serine threonine-protein kinase (703) ;mRNA; f:10644-12915